MNNTFSIDSPYLQHYGVLGMKWGIRRYQNPDGTLTALGRRRVQKAMRQHDVVMTTRDVHDRDKEYKHFRDIVTKMYPAEIAELTIKVEQAERLKRLSDLNTEDKIEKGLKYAASFMDIAAKTGTAVGNFASAANTVSQIKERSYKIEERRRKLLKEDEESSDTTFDTAVKAIDAGTKVAKGISNVVDIGKTIKEARSAKNYKKASDQIDYDVTKFEYDRYKAKNSPKYVSPTFDITSYNNLDKMTKQTVDNVVSEKNTTLAKSFITKNDVSETPVLLLTANSTISTADRLLAESRYPDVRHSYAYLNSNNELMHHGVLGMKWGIRRYQNKDGSLTRAGRERYGQKGFRSIKQYQNRINDLDTAASMLGKRIETKQSIKDTLIRSKAKTDSFIDFDGGTSLERAKSKLLGRAINSIDSSINKNAVTREQGYQEMVNIIQGLQNSGFKVTTKPTIRNVNSGKDYVANLIAGPAAAASLGFLTLGVMPGGPVLAPVAAGLVSSAVLGTSIYSLINNRAKGTKFKVEEGG